MSEVKLHELSLYFGWENERSEASWAIIVVRVRKWAKWSFMSYHCSSGEKIKRVLWQVWHAANRGAIWNEYKCQKIYRATRHLWDIHALRQSITMDRTKLRRDCWTLQRSFDVSKRIAWLTSALKSASRGLRDWDQDRKIEELWFDSRKGETILMFLKASGPTLRLTQFPTQWAPGVKRPERKVYHSLSFSVKVTN